MAGSGPLHALVRAAITPESQNENAPSLLKLLLHSGPPNRQGDIASLSLTKEAQMQASCQECFDMGLRAHIFLTTQKYQRMLARWRDAGCPDLGEWPDLHTDYFLVSYLRMAEVLGPNAKLTDDEKRAKDNRIATRG